MEVENMIRLCAWCGKIIRVKGKMSGKERLFGRCPECSDDLMLPIGADDCGINLDREQIQKGSADDESDIDLKSTGSPGC